MLIFSDILYYNQRWKSAEKGYRRKCTIRKKKLSKFMSLPVDALVYQC